MYVEFKKILFAILFCDTIKKNFTIKNSIKNINLSIIDILNLFLIYEINYLANKKNIFYYRFNKIKTTIKKEKRMIPLQEIIHRDGNQARLSYQSLDNLISEDSPESSVSIDSQPARFLGAKIFEY